MAGATAIAEDKRLPKHATVMMLYAASTVSTVSTVSMTQTVRFEHLKNSHMEDDGGRVVDIQDIMIKNSIKCEYIISVSTAGIEVSIGETPVRGE